MSTLANARNGGSATVILLGTDTPAGLAIVRDLGRHGYGVVGIGSAANAIGGASRYCGHHAVRDNDEAALVTQIKDLAAVHQASFLVATGESDILMLNRHRTELEPALKFLIPTEDVLAKVVDKSVCQVYAQQVGIRVPRTLRVSSLEEVKAAAATLSYPVVLKWADPHAAASKLKAAGLEPKRFEYALTPQDLIDRLACYTATREFPMIQEYCPGNGVGHTFLARDGEVLMEFQYERLHEWPPEGGSSAVCRAVPLSRHAEARAKSRALLEVLRWTGVAMVEYRYDPAANVYWFMEVNGRVWGSLPLAIAAGVPFAAGLVAACGRAQPIPSYDVDYPRITCCHLIPETKRLLRIMFQWWEIQDPFFDIRRARELVSYLFGLLSLTRRYYVFSFADPKPFFVDARRVALKALNVVSWLPRRGRTHPLAPSLGKRGGTRK